MAVILFQAMDIHGVTPKKKKTLLIKVFFLLIMIPSIANLTQKKNNSL